MSTRKNVLVTLGLTVSASLLAAALAVLFFTFHYGRLQFDLLNAVCGVSEVPVIASGGCGCLEHFAQVFQETDCDAALAASLFHFGELTVPQVKDFLRGRNIPVRR